MSNYTWEDQRRDVQDLLSEELGLGIEIAPRAMAALQLYATYEYEDDFGEVAKEYAPDAVLDGLLKSSPACAAALFHAGVPIERYNPPPKLGEIGAPVGWLFRHMLRSADAHVAGAVLEEDQAKYTVPTEPCSSVDEFAARVVYGYHELVPTAKKVINKGVFEETDILMAGIEATLAGTELTQFGGSIIESAGFPHPKGLRYHPNQDPKEYRQVDNYLTKVLNDIRKLLVADPSHAQIQFALYQDDSSRIRIRPFGATGISLLDVNQPVEDERSYICRDGILQPVEHVLPQCGPQTLEEFEELLNSETSSEHDFQKFFEVNPWLLTSLDFDKAHPQPILHRDEGGPLIPDFFLENMQSGWHAILDLKKPYDEMVVRKKNRVYFRQHVQNAIAQLRFYKEWFDSPSNRVRFQEEFGISTYRPRMIIVIGRAQHFLGDVERIRLIDGLADNLEIVNYDELYMRAQRYLSFRQGV